MAQARYHLDGSPALLFEGRGAPLKDASGLTEADTLYCGWANGL